MTALPLAAMRTGSGTDAPKFHSQDAEAYSPGRLRRKSTTGSGTNASLPPFLAATFPPGSRGVKGGWDVEADQVFRDGRHPEPCWAEACSGHRREKRGR